MRPIGEVRKAIGEAAQTLQAECRSATWRDLAECSRVGYGAARQTVKDMARAGDLLAVGTVRASHARRPMTLYAPAMNFAMSGSRELDDILRGWMR